MKGENKMNCLRNLSCLRRLTAAELPARGSGGGMDTLPSDMFSEIAKYIPKNDKPIIPSFLSTCPNARASVLYTMDLSNKKPVKDIFDKVSKRKVTHLNLNSCNLSNLTDDDIPETFPANLKRLDLEKPRNIPPALISRALASDSIEVLGLYRCDLSNLTDDNIPNPLPASLKKLNLGSARNTPPALISRALASNSIEELNLFYCDLSGVDVPETLSDSLKRLYLSRAKNIPPALIKLKTQIDD